MGRSDYEHSQKRLTKGKLIGLIVVAIIAAPQLLAALLAIALVASPVIIPLFIYLRRKKHRDGHQRSITNTTYTACKEEKAFDEKLQQLFCRHDDKAFHHVSRGREIDPWDRPDIDISKYQRKE